VEVLTHLVDKKKPDLPQDLSDPFSGTGWRTDKSYFHILPHEEPHARRRRAIKAKYGKEIAELEKVKEVKSFYISFAITVI
jgi:sphingolipid delta-4 desaturase